MNRSKPFTPALQELFDELKEKITAFRLTKTNHNESLPEDLRQEVLTAVNMGVQNGFAYSRILVHLGIQYAHYIKWKDAASGSATLKIPSKTYKPSKPIKLEEYDPSEEQSISRRVNKRIVVEVHHPELGNFLIEGRNAEKIWKRIAGI